jgi:hypothetical protein
LVVIFVAAWFYDMWEKGNAKKDPDEKPHGEDWYGGAGSMNNGF